jgi:hypothetical protein
MTMTRPQASVRALDYPPPDCDATRQGGRAFSNVYTRL